MIRNPRMDDVFPNGLQRDLLERERLLFRLMECKSSIRVIHAPALFGKTVLAFQYAKILFPDQGTVWIKADDPRFIKDLANKAFKRALVDEISSSESSPCELLVLDNVIAMPKEYFGELLSAFAVLKEAGIEMLITTKIHLPYLDRVVGSLCVTEAQRPPDKEEAHHFLEDENHAFDDDNSFSTMLLTARDLLLNPKEIARMFPGAPESFLSRAWPAVLCDEENGKNRLFASLQDFKIASVEEALLVLSLIVSKGPKTLLSRFIKGLDSINESDFNDRFPHAGLHARGFSALELSVKQRVSFLWVNLSRFVEFSPYSTETSFIAALLDDLLELKDFSLIQLIVKYCLNTDERSRFYDEHQLDEGSIEVKVQQQVQSSQPEVLSISRGIELSDSVHFVPVETVSPWPSAMDENKGTAWHTVSMNGSPAQRSRRTDVSGFKRLNIGAGSTLFGTLSDSVPIISSFGMASRKVSDLALENECSSSAVSLVNSIEHSSLSDDSDDRLVINLFGRFEMKRGNEPVPEKGDIRRMAKILVALLAINKSKELPRVWIEHVIWPDKVGASVSSSFYNLWSFLKKTITRNDSEKQMLGRTRETISFRELPYDCDVLQVDVLCKELSEHHSSDDCIRILTQIEHLYVGPLLPGIENAQIESYRSTYKRKVVDAMVEGTRILFKNGDVYDALHFAEYAYTQAITREDVTYNYMEILKALGNNTLAMDIYWKSHNAIVEQYGIDAPKHLDALYQDILKEA